ncbi:thioredoxin reductase (NADPH) [Thermonema lapsum]|uniref:Thioredoxin reductase (NADPH) n=1 Tax=Thermonema lapsum TaxID=28195 RepID=A0A846MRH7_9BACT|nr:YpdA family putative bacillithiol disulfide reductase [Thermonema lapsum]NIK73867.1 thioredoxin reductase (NADPH) [Thermonema lapsum]
MPNFYDVIIIGAGPCGLACAIEAHKASLRYLVVEQGSIAESIRRYPTHMRFFSTADNISIAGIPFAIAEAKANRSEALQYYRKVSEYFQLKLKLHTRVERIEPQETGFVLHTQRNEPLHCRAVIVATGYFTRPRLLQVEGENLPHVSHYYKEPFEYVHQKVVIIGGGNSAVEAALDLYRHGAQVHMLLRGNDFKPTAKYWLLPDLKRRIAEGYIQASFGCQVQRITPDAVEYRQHGQLQRLPADFVLALTGYLPDDKLLRQAGVKVDDELVPLHNEHFETNVKGLYVAGTVICGIHTEKVYIENGRLHAPVIIQHLSRQLHNELGISTQRSTH